MVDMDISGVVSILFIYFLQSIRGEVVHITVITARHTDVVFTSTGFQPRYQCYRSAPDKDATLSFGRSAQITSLLPPPPAQPHNRYPDVMEVRIPEGGGWDTNGFGPFYCQASKAGRDVTRVTTFFQRRDAKFVHNDGLFTQTVNVNDTGVTINMTVRSAANTYGNMINWRKNGGVRITSYDGLSRITFPDPIQTSDAGIYDVTYGYERNLGRGGLYRLIVRECPAGKWSPPECYGICDKCYNGGVCDDKSGRCICPNNFKGPNCLEICKPGGGNRFGLNCEFRCTDNIRDRLTACHGYLFCLPDPYGCSCDVGVKGHACDQACSAGYYGPGCSERCHCASGTCDKYTGGCTDGCRNGWSGDNCQIPDVCGVGYYGPQCTDKCHCLYDAPCQHLTGECPRQECAVGYRVRSDHNHCQECGDGSFGPDCLPLCHCAADVCETTTGRCDGQCLHNWIEPDCRTGISNLVLMKVNSYQASTFTCYVEGDPLPDESSVHLYLVIANTYNNTGISRRSSSVSDMERAVVFDVDSVHPEQYVCIVSIASEETAYFPVINTSYGECKGLVNLQQSGRYWRTMDVPVLPVIDEAPLVLNTWSSAVRLKWNAWSDEDDLGDPTLVGYDIFMKADSDWIKAQRVDQFTTSANVRDLNPDTDYIFSVAAVRVGSGGTGPRSPGASTVTLCEKPSTSPTKVQTTAQNPKEFEVTWQLIGNASEECRSGVTHYVIYYITIGSTSASSVMVYNASSYTITGLETFMDYTIQMTAANKDEESDRSFAIVSRTLEEEVQTPLYVLVTGVAGPLLLISLLIFGLVLWCKRFRAQRHLKDTVVALSQDVTPVTFDGSQDPLRVTPPTYLGLNEHIYSDIPGTHTPIPVTNSHISGTKSPISGRNLPLPETYPSLPRNKPSLPRNKPTHPRNKSGHPGNKPSVPRDKPSLPGNKPTHPENKPGHPGNKPTNPGDKTARPGNKLFNPGNRHAHPGSAHETREDPRSEEYINRVVIKMSEICRRPIETKP